ncbi:EpsG family protein [Deinococcus taklimakanensis]|uniref:EpsG family protein n=1 Tax=Deinococcus taklimakanensis TaxID=536443 RepID=A0ABW5P1W1_9DEIO
MTTLNVQPRTIAKNSAVHDRIWNCLLFLPVLIYAFRWGTRSFTVGADTGAYVGMFLAYLKQDPAFINSIDKGFLGLISFSRLFSTDPQSLLLVVCLFEAVCFYLAGVLFLRRPFYVFLYVVFLLISPFYLSININILRHGTAIAVALLGMAVVFRLRKPVYRVLLAYPPVLFHNVAGLLATPIFIGVTRINMIYAWLTLITISIFSGLYSSFVSQYLTGRYVDYAAAETTYRVGFRPDFTFFSSLPIFLLLIVPFRKMGSETRWVFNAYLLINSVGSTMNFISFSDRMLTNSWVMLPLLFALVIRDINDRVFKKRVNKNFFTFAVIAVMLMINLVFYVRPGN